MDILTALRLTCKKDGDCLHHLVIGSLAIKLNFLFKKKKTIISCCGCFELIFRKANKLSLSTWVQNKSKSRTQLALVAHND